MAGHFVSSGNMLMRLLYIEIKNAAQHFVFSKLSKLQAFQKYFYDYDDFYL